MVSLCTTSFNIHKLDVLPTEYVCVFLCISEQRAIISLCNIKWWNLLPRRIVFTMLYEMNV